MKLKIYTPGHGLFLDTLIMYGFSSILQEGDFRYNVTGTAQMFEINVEDASLMDIAKVTKGLCEKSKESIIELLVNRLRLVQRQSLRRMEYFLEKMINMNVIKQLLRSYSSPGHALGEGREATRKQHVWLPLFPHIGKYFTGEYKYRAKNYGICPSCLVLASLGFYKAALHITPPLNRNNIYVVLLSFEGHVSGEILNRLIALKSDIIIKPSLRRATSILPLSVFIRTLLAYLSPDLLKNLYEAKASWTALSVMFNIIKGGVVQIRGYEEMTLNTFLSSLVRLMEIDEKRERKVNPIEKLTSLTEDLIRKGDTTAIESLYDFLVTRTSLDLYTASRQITKTLEEGFGKQFCEELAWLIK